jgi:hypothetical protein
MKNFLVILLGVIVLFGLWWLSKDQETLPNVLMAQDTTEINIEEGIEGENDKIIEGADSSSMQDEVKAEFLRKTYTNCLSTIYKIPNSHVEELENSVESISFINAYVNGIHHMLYFDNGICTSDEILKD